MENSYQIKKTSKYASVLQKIGPYLFLTLGGIIMVYPFVYSLLGSVSTVEEYKNSLLLPVPRHPFRELGNYAILFRAETDILFPMRKDMRSRDWSSLRTKMDTMYSMQVQSFRMARSLQMADVFLVLRQREKIC